jgi:hypothetical protein
MLLEQIIGFRASLPIPKTQSTQQTAIPTLLTPDLIWLAVQQYWLDVHIKINRQSSRQLINLLHRLFPSLTLVLGGIVLTLVP